MAIPIIPSGMLNIDKPQGITSHDVVDVIRKIFQDVKIGHTGTLDPLATGVLQICIGDATKLTNYLTNVDKKYRVKMMLGVETDTYDITGRIMFASVVNKDEVYIKERIKRFVGTSLQTPPIYSAIRVEGKRAYQYAREGKEVELKQREITIHSIENIKVNINLKEVSFDVHCTKGTYVRSLVNDIGKKIGCGGTMTELVRLSNGDFEIENSIKLYEFLNLEYKEMLEKIIPLPEYSKKFKKVELDDNEYTKFLNGVKMPVELKDEIVRIVKQNKFIGLGIVEEGNLKRFIV